MSARRAAQLDRYTDRRTSFFSPGCFRPWGFDDALGRFRGFGRNTSNSFEHSGNLQKVAVGFVGRGFSSGGAGWLRRIRQCATAGLKRGLRFSRRAAFGSSGGAGSSNILSVWGSLEGPYNIRLHLTAPREHRSHSVRGESRDIEYGSGARVQTINIGSSGGRVRVRATRRACDSPRPERTRSAAGELEPLY